MSNNNNINVFKNLAGIPITNSAGQISSQWQTAFASLGNTLNILNTMPTSVGNVAGLTATTVGTFTLNLTAGQGNKITYLGKYVNTSTDGMQIRVLNSGTTLFQVSPLTTASNKTFTIKLEVVYITLNSSPTVVVSWQYFESDLISGANTRVLTGWGFGDVQNITFSLRIDGTNANDILLETAYVTLL